MDVFQQAIEESRRQFEKQLEAKRKKEQQKEKELQEKKEEAQRKKREEQKQKKQEEEERARMEREAKLKEEYTKLCNEKNQHLKSGEIDEFSMSMKSIITREVEFHDGPFQQPDQSQDLLPPSHVQINSNQQKEFSKLNQMLYNQDCEDVDQSIMSSGVILQRKFNIEKPSQIVDEQNKFDVQFSKTEKIESDNYGGQLNVRASEQLITNPLIGRQTAPESFIQFKNQLEDPQKQNFMNTNQNMKQEDQLSEKISWEQKQLLILEKQQNELQLKLLKMQQDFQHDQDKQSQKLQNQQNQIQDWFEKEENKNPQIINNTIESQVKELCNDIQKEQEQIIKQIVLQSAVQTVKNESEDQIEQNLQKSLKGDELIKSICNTSGVFIKEFREIKDDPYAREEFIMSISKKSAVFDQIIHQKHEDQQFQNTAKSSIKNLNSSTKQKNDLSAAGNRKLKLMYDLEVNGKIKQIQYKQIKQKEQEEQQRLKIGQNLFAQLVGQQIENQQKINSENQPVQVTFSKQINNEDSDNFDEDIERDCQDEEHNIEETVEDSAMFTEYDNVPEIEASTGTFGEKQNLQLQLNMIPQQSNNGRQLLSARPPIDQNKQKINKNSNLKFRPVSGFSNLTKDSIPTRSGMDTSSASSFARQSDSQNTQKSKINQRFSSSKSNAYGTQDKNMHQNHNFDFQNKDILASIMNEPSYDFDGEKNREQNNQNEDQEVEEDEESDERDDQTQFDLDNVSVSLAGKTNKTAILNQSFGEDAHQVYTKDDLRNYQQQIELAIKEELERLQLEKSNKLGDSTFKRDGDTQFLKQLDYTYSSQNPYEHSFNEKHATTELESRDSKTEFENTQKSMSGKINDKTLGLDDIVESMDASDDRRRKLDDYQQQSEEKFLDPAPKTAQAQARYFFYEINEASISVKSKDFDNIYQHGRTDQLDGLIKSDIKQSNNLDESDLVVDKDELTFGSRPATAQTQNADIENSFVNIGQITIDKKNQILGNNFQDPNQNQHSPMQKKKISQQLNYDNDDLERELQELKNQNEEILKQIEKQKKQNYLNLENLEIGKDYVLEETINKKEESQSSNKEDYEEDQFEQEQSDDEYTLTELQRQKINQFQKLSNKKNNQLSSQISINQEDRSPRQNQKNKYYDCLDESSQLKMKQSMQDPLKQFYMDDTAEQDQINEMFGVKDNQSDTYSNDSNEKQFNNQIPLQPQKRKPWQQKKEQTVVHQEQESEQFKNQQMKQPVLIDLNDEQSNTIKMEKLRRFEEFKLKREQAEEKRKNKANEKRQKSKQPYDASEIQAKNIPQTQQISDSSKTKDLIASPSDFSQNKIIPKPNMNNIQRIQSAQKTPGQKSDMKQNMPKGFKGIMPNQIKEQAQPFLKVRQDSAQRIQQQLNQVRQKQRTPNNWVNEKTQNLITNSDFENEADKYYFNDEESKYDKEAQNEGIKLPPIPQTPSTQQIKSIAAPSIVPRKAMVKNSNKKLIRLALQLVVLAGQTEPATRERQEVLAVIDATDFEQYVILFKGQTGRFDFRALYSVQQDEINGQHLSKIYGQTSNLSPMVILDDHIDKFFKYNSGQKTFIETGGQKCMTLTVDAIILKKIKK